MVFASDATDIQATSFGQSTVDSNNQTDVFLFYLDTNSIHLVNLNKFNQQATGGPSDQPVISGDGSVIAYRSSATNLVFEKGIATVEVVNGGVGYFGSPTIIVADLNQSGTGPRARFSCKFN